jgi:hypothetical protein
MSKKETAKLESRFDQALAIQAEKLNTLSHDRLRHEHDISV